MKDYATAKDRLSTPLAKWVREGFKELMVCIVCFSIFGIFLLNQPVGIV